MEMGIYTDHVPRYLHIMGQKFYSVVNQDAFFVIGVKHLKITWKGGKHKICYFLYENQF